MNASLIRTLVGLAAAAVLSTGAHAAETTLGSALGGLSKWTYLGDESYSFAKLGEATGTKLSFKLVGENTAWVASQTFSIVDGTKSVAIFAGADTTGAMKDYAVSTLLNGIAFNSNSGVASQKAPNGFGTDFFVFQSKAESNLYGFAYEDYLFPGTIDFNDMVVTMNVTAVPEPETYALMLGGLGAVWMLGRRRRAQD